MGLNFHLCVTRTNLISSDGLLTLEEAVLTTPAKVDRLSEGIRFGLIFGKRWPNL